MQQQTEASTSNDHLSNLSKNQDESAKLKLVEDDQYIKELK